MKPDIESRDFETAVRKGREDMMFGGGALFGSLVVYLVPDPDLAVAAIAVAVAWIVLGILRINR